MVDAVTPETKVTDDCDEGDTGPRSTKAADYDDLDCALLLEDLAHLNREVIATVLSVTCPFTKQR